MILKDRLLNYWIFIIKIKLIFVVSLIVFEYLDINSN